MKKNCEKDDNNLIFFNDTLQCFFENNMLRYSSVSGTFSNIMNSAELLGVPGVQPPLQVTNLGFHKSY